MKCSTVAMMIAAFGLAQFANAFNSHPKDDTVRRSLYIQCGSIVLAYNDNLTPFLFLVSIDVDSLLVVVVIFTMTAIP
jgi:hypothetical protein